MRVAIGTTSELKIRSLENALYKLQIKAEIHSIKTDSGVSNQPFGYKETTQGAKNRAKHALESDSFDIGFGIENGLIEIEGNFFDIACVCIKTKEGEESISYSSGYFTPQWIVEEIKEKHTDYGHITQRLSGDTDKDPIKYFSGGKVKREELLSQAIEIALIKILNKARYAKQ
ncbi:MAG: inosine/xanthosine triphosphatase [Candidatus Paceibacterota bacterium]